MGGGADRSPVAVKFKAPSPSDTLSRRSAAHRHEQRGEQMAPAED